MQSTRSAQSEADIAPHAVWKAWSAWQACNSDICSQDTQASLGSWLAWHIAEVHGGEQVAQPQPAAATM
jgi:hypothetical protein